MKKQNEITIHIPDHAKRVLNALHQAGFEAYVVGGCVRDSLLGREPEDWDITTSAKPEQVKAIFGRTVDTGIKHGTVTVLIGKDSYEVTTYRIDGEYKDGRHPESVEYTRSLLEDLKRRDFTINAMAYSDETGIIDEFDGLGDIDRRLIRAVGKPEERFSEDALRIMRAVRFSAQLDYTLDEATRLAAHKLAPNLSRISAERIRVELEKLLVSPHPEKIRDAYRMGITKVILPEFDLCMLCTQNNPHHMYSVGEHIIHSVCNVPADRILRLTMFLHDIGKPESKIVGWNDVEHFQGHVDIGADMANQILRRLRYDNDTRRKVVQLIRWHEERPAARPAAVRRLIVNVGEDLFPDWLLVKRADIMAQSLYMRPQKLERLDQIEKIYQGIIDRRDCLNLKNLAVSGKDLIALGIRGEEVGQILNAMLQDVLSDPSHNNRERLLRQYASPHFS